jgi:hypothetical protein
MIINELHQLSTINYQLSTINYQLSTINYQLSTINYQLILNKLMRKHFTPFRQRKNISASLKR